MTYKTLVREIIDISYSRTLQALKLMLGCEERELPLFAAQISRNRGFWREFLLEYEESINHLP